MTILTLPRKELEKHIGKVNEKLEHEITMFGTPIEEVSDSEVLVEVFPNRPDLLSMQGFVRAINEYRGKKKNVTKYKVEKPGKDYKVIVDKSVKKVRPYTSCAIVKGLKFDDKKIIEIIDLQEKLHGSYGRNRKKVAIGIYPLEEIKLPIRFMAKKPEDIKFQPLEFPRVINGRQILSQHPKGRDYAELLKDQELFPIFIDANDEILSMPPVINSEKTGKISSKTEDIFIECSGFDYDFLAKTLNMIVTALADMGGKVYSMEINDVNKKYMSPNLEPERLEFSPELINKTLGLELNSSEIKKYLKKMGIEVEKKANKSFALIPSYRGDILHEIDLSEEIAISYGYDKFIPEIPKISTIGSEDKMSILKRKISEVLIGLNFLEISTFHLSTKEKQFKSLGIKEYLKDVIEVENSKTENNILRTSLLSNTIQVLSENSDASYPQKVFELGKIFYNDESLSTKISEDEHLSIAIVSEKANFTEIKQVLDYLSRMFGFEYKLSEKVHSSFIEGRCGEVRLIKNKKEIPIGVIGEISPNILKNNKIKMPTCALEINIKELLN